MGVFDDIGDFFTEDIGGAVDDVGSKFKNFFDKIGAFLKDLESLFVEIGGIFEAIGKFIVGIIKNLIKIAPDFLDFIENSLVLFLTGIEVLNVIIILAPALLILYYTSYFISFLESERTISVD